MIMKYNKFNEGIKHLLVGPNKQEVWKNLGYDRTFDTHIEYMDYLINNLKKGEEDEDGRICLFLNNSCLFLRDNEAEILSVDKRVFNILHNIFGLRVKEINNMLYDRMGKFLNWYYFLLRF